MKTATTLWQRARLQQALKRWKWLGIALALAVLASLSGFNPYWHPFYFGSKSMQVPTEYQWHCLGRYQIMLPKGFMAETEQFKDMFTLFYGLDGDHKRVAGRVMNKDHSPEAFERAYHAHRDQLARTINDDTQKPMLLKEEQIGERAFLLRRMERDSSENGVFTELHQLVGSRYVILKADSFRKDSDVKPYLVTVDFSDAEARLKTISPKLFAITQATASRPGFCFGGVVFDSGQDTERTNFDFRWTDTPDQPVTLEVSYQGVLDPGTREPFSARMANLPLKSRLSVQTLRDRMTQVGPGLPWHELLIRLPGWDVPERMKAEPMHMFLGQHAHNQGTTLDKPDFELRLVLGGGGDAPEASPLSDADALAMWDKIVKSIRPRTAQ